MAPSVNPFSSSPLLKRALAPRPSSSSTLTSSSSSSSSSSPSPSPSQSPSTSASAVLVRAASNVAAPLDGSPRLLPALLASLVATALHAPTSTSFSNPAALVSPIIVVAALTSSLPADALGRALRHSASLQRPSPDPSTRSLRLVPLHSLLAPGFDVEDDDDGDGDRNGNNAPRDANLSSQSSPKKLDELLTALTPFASPSSGPPASFVIVIDSLHLLTVEFGRPAVSRFLAKLVRAVNEANATLLAIDTTLPVQQQQRQQQQYENLLPSLFTTTIDIFTEHDWATLSDPRFGGFVPSCDGDEDVSHRAIYRVTHRKKSGKVEREAGTVRAVLPTPAPSSLGAALEFRPFVAPPSLAESIKSLKPSGKAADPTQNLSFNLSLTESQQEARAGIVLPYMEAQRQHQHQHPHQHPHQPSHQQHGAGGAIYFERDVGDSDEDPDDDLDI
ncbi:Elongator subunit Iki1-domain-containing protein [Zopfochytrium polystomum]|nr:Elongator subunit Iki1-domain-containing protein [Zopfochytrium polystomum]